MICLVCQGPLDPSRDVIQFTPAPCHPGCTRLLPPAPEFWECWCGESTQVPPFSHVGSERHREAMLVKLDPERDWSYFGMPLGTWLGWRCARDFWGRR